MLGFDWIERGLAFGLFSSYSRGEAQIWFFLQLLIQLEAVSRASIGNETNHMMLTADDAIRMTTGITL